MAQWETMVKLFDAMRSMAAEMIEGFPDDSFDDVRGGGNSAKWITGHLALGMDFGLNLLDQPSERIPEMMPTYGPGSPGGEIGDDGRTKESLLEHFRSVGEQLKEAVIHADEELLKQPNETPFLAKELPTVGDLLGHVFTTHLAMHMGQLSQMRREMGLTSVYDFG
ncbi:MAG: DinB family protein [Planctomycetota bacterium]